MPEIRACDPDVVVMADADVWCWGLESAVRAVTVGAAAWAMPHRLVKRLTRRSTERLIAGDTALELDRRPYGGMWGGGIVVAHRDTFLEVPMDRRFVGFGNEDESWAMALWTIAGEPWRGDADLIHLWHPHQQRVINRRGSPESWALRQRYAAARGKPDEMRALIREV